MAYQRRIILIDPPFQLRFSLYVVSWIFVLSLFYPFLIFEIFDSFVSVIPSTQAAGMAGRIASRRNELIGLLVAMQLLFAGVTFLMTMYLSHRIAGPIYKLKKFLSESTGGKLLAPMTFRKADHFQDLAGFYNAAARSIEERDTHVREAVSELEGLKASLSGADRQRLESALSRLGTATPGQV
jgi:hypothetical protein